MKTAEQIVKINEELAGKPTGEILRWCYAEFGSKLVMTSSFQTQSVPLLHQISVYAPKIRVLFLNTGFHFPETLQFKDGLSNLLSLNIEEIECEIGREGFEEKYGHLYTTNPNLCCQLNKVAPLKLALKNATAWVSGIRRDQTEVRAKADIVQLTAEGVIKVWPMLEWTAEKIRDYLSENHLPAHPLLNRGYLSIGCAPCTKPVNDTNNERIGRWLGSQKFECGLHTEI